MNILLSYHEGYFLDFVKEVFDYLTDYGHVVLKLDRECLSPLHYKDKDLILAIGGDGTFLRTSHLNQDVPMIGINPNPEKKEGFFMQLTKENYKKYLNTAIQKKSSADYFRLKIKINGEELKERALNEVYIGSEKSYTMFNYDLVLRTSEFQRSSGILIGTPAGSHAWIKSAGGKMLRLSDNRFQYLVREPYEGKITGKFKYKKGILSKEKKIAIIPKSFGILVIDSVSKTYPLRIDDVIFVEAGEPLRCLK